MQQYEAYVVAAVSAMGTVALMVVGKWVKDAFFKGAQQEKNKRIEDELILIQNTIASIIKTLNDMKAEINSDLSMLKQKDETKTSIINRMVRDHEALEESIEKMNTNINQNNQALAKLDATLDGVNRLLQNIFDGNLKIAKA